MADVFALNSLTIISNVLTKSADYRFREERLYQKKLQALGAAG